MVGRASACVVVNSSFILFVAIDVGKTLASEGFGSKTDFLDALEGALTGVAGLGVLWLSVRVNIGVATLCNAAGVCHTGAISHRASVWMKSAVAVAQSRGLSKGLMRGLVKCACRLASARAT